MPILCVDFWVGIVCLGKVEEKQRQLLATISFTGTTLRLCSGGIISFIHSTNIY